MSEQPVDCRAASSPRAALVWATLGFFAGFAGVSAFGPVLPLLRQSLEVGPLGMGLLAASPALTGSLLRIPSGALVDRYGGKKLIVALLLLAAAGIGGLTVFFGVVGAPQAAHFPLFLGFAMLCGCGIAVFSVGVPAVSYWYPQRRQGTALALYGGLGNLAPGLFALLLPALVTAVGFTRAFVLWLAGLVLVALAIGLRMKDAPYFQYREMGLPVEPEELRRACGEELVPAGKALASIRQAARDWRTWVLTYFYFLTFGGFVAFTAWLPTFWVERFGCSLVRAGMLTAFFSLSASLLRIAGGIASDRLGGDRVVAAALAAVGLGGTVMALVQDSLAAAVAAEGILALGMGFGNAAVFKLVPRYTPASVGGAAGIIGGLGAFGGFVFPPLIGGIVRAMGQAGYGAGFWLFPLLSLVALALFYGLRCEHPGVSR